MSTRETTLTSAGTAPARRRSTGFGGSLRAIYIVWYRDLLRYWRDRPRILVSLAQPLLFWSSSVPAWARHWAARSAGAARPAR